MNSYLQNYINGNWVDSIGGTKHQVISPSTEAACTEITLGTQADVDAAVAAARAAFDSFAQTTREQRIELLQTIVAEYQKRAGDIAQAISTEMGCPISVSQTAQVGSGIGHFMSTIEALKNFEFEEKVGANKVVHEAIGVVALITPWNWPMNQIVAKVAPAIAAGCTMILKPSEECPGAAAIFAEVMHAAGVPAGVFNLVQGDGPTVGSALAKHPGVDMISITGSTRAGIAVAKDAADTVKRVHQELGGKSPNIILPGAPLDQALPAGLGGVCLNSGQSCIAPARVLVHKSQYAEAVKIAADYMNAMTVGDPLTEGAHLGPVVNKSQWNKIQGLIQAGIAEGAEVAAGGAGLPENVSKGFYVKPTLFSNVTNDMTVAREEIFGPVITMIQYDDVDDAVRIANDTNYGLSSVICGDPVLANQIAPRIRAGMVYINAGTPDASVPFGGYKQSGNGREFSKWGIAEFMEIKSYIGMVM
jgi:aldehyde dehydrogenase (NAD+)